jgi:hypothetical protein
VALALDSRERLGRPSLPAPDWNVPRAAADALAFVKLTADERRVCFDLSGQWLVVLTHQLVANLVSIRHAVL